MHYAVMVFSEHLNDVHRLLSPYDFDKVYEGCKSDEEYASINPPPILYDFYEIGGRFSRWIRLKEPDICDVTRSKISDIDWGFTGDEFDVEYEKTKSFYNAAINGKVKGFRKKDVIHYLGTDVESYSIQETALAPPRVLMPDGTYHGLSFSDSWKDQSIDERKKWAREFKSRFVDTLDPNYIATIVDCHI